MDAGKVAGLLVLLGVVGVLAAIVGSGIEAGPVKFRSIPRSRQALLAVASVCVIAGGVAWWAVQRHSGSGGAAGETVSVPKGGLRVVLIPARGNIARGEPISVTSQVIDADGEIGASQCVMHWRDEVDGSVVRTDTTACDATFREPAAARAGVHRITAAVEGIAGASGSGSASVSVTVS